MADSNPHTLFSMNGENQLLVSYKQACWVWEVNGSRLLGKITCHLGGIYMNVLEIMKETNLRDHNM
jgi:hypothetical protein